MGNSAKCSKWTNLRIEYLLSARYVKYIVIPPLIFRQRAEQDVCRDGRFGRRRRLQVDWRRPLGRPDHPEQLVGRHQTGLIHKLNSIVLLLVKKPSWFAWRATKWPLPVVKSGTSSNRQNPFPLHLVKLRNRALKFLIHFSLVCQAKYPNPIKVIANRARGLNHILQACFGGHLGVVFTNSLLTKINGKGFWRFVPDII